MGISPLPLRAGSSPCFMEFYPTHSIFHFCGLVRAMRIILQHNIKHDDILTAHDLLVSFAHRFELLYYQRRTDRLHFVRQSIHALLHLAPEVFRIGPPICSSQWTMERTIGNLGQEIRQPSNPFANLSQRGLLRCQVNALTAMLPGPLAAGTTNPDRGWQLPRGAIDLGNGYVLLRAQDNRPSAKCRQLKLKHSERIFVNNILTSRSLLLTGVQVLLAGPVCVYLTDR